MLVHLCLCLPVKGILCMSAAEQQNLIQKIEFQLIKGPHHFCYFSVLVQSSWITQEQVDAHTARESKMSDMLSVQQIFNKLVWELIRHCDLLG